MAEVYVDIDGTLTVETKGWGEKVYRERTPRLDVIEHINKLYSGSNRITLWSSRHVCDRTVTIEWLRIHGVKYHKLILGKPLFDIYICDHVQNVEDLVNEISK